MGWFTELGRIFLQNIRRKNQTKEPLLPLLLGID
jgi:hypothetical protein